MGKKPKTARPNNKKKPRGAAEAPSSRVPAGPRDDAPNFPETSLPHFGGNSLGKKNNGAVFGGYHEIYKLATSNFWQWMKETLPQTPMKAVNDLPKGVHHIFKHNCDILDSHSSDNESKMPIFVPKYVLKQLSTGIQYRELLTQTRYGHTGADEGHAYMVRVLRHCRDVLQSCRQVAKTVLSESRVVLEESGRTIDAIGGRFNALILDDEEEDEDQEDLQAMEDIRERKLPSFDPPQEIDEKIDIEDLINGDDRFQAMALLHTMDDLMGAVHEHYAMLKRFLRDQEFTGGNPIQLSMECAAVANLATESIMVAENALTANHPHLESFYHVLALVFMPEIISNIEKLLPQPKREDGNLALGFVAVLVECCFHNKQGPNEIANKVKRFAKKSGIAVAALEEEARKVHTLTAFEIQIQAEESRNAGLNMVFQQQGIHSHMWLEQNAYIGGDRCILNTQALCQKILDIVQGTTKLVGRPNYWGPTFDERTHGARRLRGDLDEALAGCILPELIALCMRAPFHRLPDASQLMTVLYLLHMQMKGDWRRPVPVALTFGLHAILTSVYVLQGEGDLARVAEFSKRSYNCLFAQLDELSDPTQSPENAPTFYRNVALFKNLVNFAQPVQATLDFDLVFLDPAVSEKLALWNPVIGGGYLLYATYVCSIGLGSATVDSLGQARMALHLYHALKQRDASLNVPFLHDIDRVLAKTKAIWAGGRPQKGSYCKHFWIAWGMSIDEATRMATDCTAEDPVRSNRRPTGVTRNLDEILPQEYSKSYRRLVLQDFTDDEGVTEYTVRNETTEQRKQFRALFDLLTRVNMTRDSMDDDEDLVTPVNFTAVGCILLEFTNALSSEMGWDSLIGKAMLVYPEEMRTGKTMGGRRMKPGDFNTSDLNAKCQGMAHMCGMFLSWVDRDFNSTAMDKVAQFMVNFFEQVPKEQYTFFREGERSDGGTTGSNPLEGPFPYGRTGKSPREPLAGFCHFKFSKRGRPVARLVTPGRYTPYCPTPSGDIGTPYEEKGSRVPRLGNGKYRHIASYSLSELIALGWDGAMYNSSKGRGHGVKGRYVPFIVGYDSDSEDEYEPVDIPTGQRAGVIGLSAELQGAYMTMPDFQNPGQSQLVQLKKIA